MAKAGYCEACPYFHNEKVKNIGSQTPQLVIVGAFPSSFEVKQGRFPNKSGMYMVSKLVHLRRQHIPQNERFGVAYRYAVMCSPFTADGEFQKPSAEEIYRCSVNLKDFLQRTRPKAVVLLGTDAFKALGIKSPIKSVRGSIFDQEYGGQNVKVLTTYNPYQVKENPGLFETFKKDINKAVDLVTDQMEEHNFTLEMPRQYEEVVDALNRSIDYVESNGAEKERRQLVAIDTETTGLEPHKEGFKVIAASASVRSDHGLAYLIDHREADYTQEQRDHILELTQRLKASEYSLTAAANAKFDYKALAFTYGMNIPFFNVDVLLTEHILDEDKKGEYKLKHLISDYYPSMGRYEEQLQEWFKKIKQEREQERKKHYEEYKEKLHDSFIQYWLNLTEQERRDKLTKWVNKKYVSLSQTTDLVEVKTRKQKGEQVILKKYKDKVVKMLKKIPSEELQDLDLPEFTEEVPEVTYEDLPVDEMLKYAAIDALGTYKVSMKQITQMKDDTKNVASKYNDMPSLLSSLFNLSMPLCEKLAHIEHNGVKVNRDRMQSYMDIMTDYMERYKKEVYKQVGRKFNLSSSSPELPQILFDEMGFETIRYTDSGAPATDHDTFKTLYGRHKTEFLKYMMDYRKIEKVRNTYVKNWMKLSEYDGRLHAQFHQNATATYRLSSTQPNL